jgi:hypothetical protein
MIRVITVEREYGSQGAEFAYHLAHRLQWKLVDQCLIDEIAAKAGIPRKLAESCDERLDPWYYRFGKAFWHGSLERLPAVPDPEFFDAERMVEFVRDYLHQQVKAGQCVIVGRGATSALLTTPGVFHVFVHASMKRKVEWFMKNFPQHGKDAEQEIQATDKRRAAYVRRFYNRDWTDYRLYHLMLNSCMGFDAMVKSTIDAAGLSASVPQHAEL